MTVAAFVTSGTNYPLLDGILGMSLVVHSHIGVSALSAYRCLGLRDISFMCVVLLMCCFFGCGLV